MTFGGREMDEKAMAELDGSKLAGRQLRVSEAENCQADIHSVERPQRVPVAVEIGKRVDDRPTGNGGKRVRNKSI